MKLLPSWTAVLPGSPQGRAWPWAQRPRSRWTLRGLGRHGRARKVKTLVPVFRDAQGGQGTSGCQSLDETWSLPRARLALDTAYTCVQWVVSLRQSLGLRGAYFASSKLLQKNKLEQEQT